jgi:proton glutamate symport protein
MSSYRQPPDPAPTGAGLATAAHRRVAPTTLIFAGMAVGLLIGWLWPGVEVYARPVSQIFIRLIKTIIAPLLFATLVTGIAGHANLRTVGKIGLRSLIYFEIVTTLALLIGLAFVNLTRPGVGIVLPPEAAPVVGAKKQTLSEVLVHVFPQSFFQAAAEGEILQVVVFSVLFGIAVSRLGDRKATMLEFCEALAATMFKFTGLVMTFAPVGVGAAIATTVGSQGLTVLSNLGAVLLTYYASVAFFVGTVLWPAALLFRVPVRRFIRAIKEPALIAFSTTSSEAALPKAMEAMTALGAPRSVVAFVMPLGYSFNLDGSSLYLSLASVFVAQAAGITLTFSQQLWMVLTLMVTSKGVAGVPRASLVILAGTLASFHLPAEGVAVLLAIDGLMDMARSALNVIGNGLAAVVMARWEGQFQPIPESISTRLPP